MVDYLVDQWDDDSVDLMGSTMGTSLVETKVDLMVYWWVDRKDK